MLLKLLPARTAGTTLRCTALALAVAGALAASGCGGGQPAAAAEAPPTATDAAPPTADGGAPSETSAAAGVLACERVPTLRAGTRRSVREFGATANDDRDDSDAVQRALDTLAPGETLWFEPGRYVFNRSLHVRRPGITISGSDAELHATNPDDMALWIEADDTAVADLTFTAVTAGRRDAPRHARIAVVADLGGGNYRPVRNVTIRDNRIVNGGPPGSAQANGSSASGIFLLRAERFLVAHNTVVRTLADGIHVTGGSKDGRVLNNVVRETGDDMIAMVSYAGTGPAALDSAQRLRDSWAQRVDTRLVRNVLVAGNRVEGPYWGRGISVVGGQRITIARNNIANVPLAAAVLLAREANYLTFGVDDVVVEGNVIRDVQTLSPLYDVASTFTRATRTGHGALEVHAAQFDDEAADSTLRGLLTVRQVMARNNTVERSSASAMRAGVEIRGSISERNSAGATVTRSFRPATIEGVAVRDSAFNQVRLEPVDVMTPQGASTAVNCSGNRRDGSGYNAPRCNAALPTVQGASMTCGSDGVMR